MAIKYVTLTTGYVESGSASILILENQTGIGFQTKREALRNLAAGVFQKYLWDHSIDVERTKNRRACCEKTLECNSSAKFCMTCSTKFSIPEIMKQQFVDFLSEMCHATADDWGSDDIVGWSPWVGIHEVMRNATVSEVLAISELGAEVVAEFLSPDDVPEEFRSSVSSWPSQSGWSQTVVRYAVQKINEEQP